MWSDASENTLVCELGPPTGSALLFAAGTITASALAITLPLPIWARGVLLPVILSYGSVSLWRWWRSMPMRLVVTGDGRCRVITRAGRRRDYGPIRGGRLGPGIMMIEAGDARRRRVFLTAGMADPAAFRRLRVRLRTLAAP